MRLLPLPLAGKPEQGIASRFGGWREFGGLPF